MKNTHYLYSIRFFSNFAQAIFFPFMALWLLKEKLFSANEAAVIVSCGLFATRFLSVIFSTFIQKNEKRHVILLSLFSLMILHLLLYSLYSHGIANFFIYLFLFICIGGMLSVNTLGMLSFLADEKKENEQHHGFSMMNIMMNLSAGVGPFLGGLILVNATHYFLLVPIIFLFLGLLFALPLKGRTVTQSIIRPLTTVVNFGGKSYWLLMLCNALTFLGYAQFYDIFPLYASHWISIKHIGFLFVVSSVAIVFMQLPINQALKNKTPCYAIVLANVMLAFGTLLFLLHSSEYLCVCVIGVVLISFGELIYAPLYQSLAIQSFAPKSDVCALAFQSVTWGLAEALATGLGIHWVGVGEGDRSFVFGGIAAMLVCVILWSFYSRIKTWV